MKECQNKSEISPSRERLIAYLSLLKVERGNKTEEHFALYSNNLSCPQQLALPTNRQYCDCRSEKEIKKREKDREVMETEKSSKRQVLIK